VISMRVRPMSMQRRRRGHDFLEAAAAMLPADGCRTPSQTADGERRIGHPRQDRRRREPESNPRTATGVTLNPSRSRTSHFEADRVVKTAPARVANCQNVDSIVQRKWRYIAQTGRSRIDKHCGTRNLP